MYVPMPPPTSSSATATPPSVWLLGAATIIFTIIVVLWVYLAPRSTGGGWSLLAVGIAVAMLLVGTAWLLQLYEVTKRLGQILIGIVGLAVVIYASYILVLVPVAKATTGGWSGAWSYVAYILAALAAVVFLAMVWIWFGSVLQAQTGLLGLVVQLIFAIPCLVAWLAQYAVNDFRGTAPATLLLLAAETALLGAFVFRRPLERAGRAVAGWVLPPGILTPTDRVVTRLQTDRVFLNYETRLGNRPLPEDNGAPETRAKTQLTPTRSLGQNQDYRVTFDVFLHALDLGAGAAFPVLRYAEGSSSSSGGGGGCPSVYFEGAGAPGAGGGRVWTPNGDGGGGTEGFRIKKASAGIKRAAKKTVTVVKKSVPPPLRPPPPSTRTAASKKAPPPPAAAAAAAAPPVANNVVRTPPPVSAATTPPVVDEDAEDQDPFVPNVVAMDNQRNSAQLRVFLTNNSTGGASAAGSSSSSSDRDVLLLPVPLQRWVELAFYYTRTQVDVFVDRRLVHSLSWRPDNRPVFGPSDQFVVGSPVPNGAALGSLRNLAVETPYPLINKYGSAGEKYIDASERITTAGEATSKAAQNSAD